MKKVYDNNTGILIDNLKVNKDNDIVLVNRKPCNFQINDRQGNIEIVYYVKPFLIPNHVLLDDELILSNVTVKEIDEVLNQRKFQLINNVVTPLEDFCTIHDLKTSIYRSSKRAKKNFYNYALSNDWEYFITLTFADQEARFDKDVLYSYWNSFIKSLRYKNKKIKAIAVYEHFKESKGYHIHALLSQCDLSLQPARHAKTNEFIYSSSGNQIFNIKDWSNGYSTAVLISPNSNQMQVVNYLSKYMTKESAAPYGCKRYFRTQNLDTSFNYVDYKEYDEVQDLVKSLGLEVYKEVNGVVYYR